MPQDFNLNQPFQGRGDCKMCAEHLTIAEMERKYPNEWLFIIEPEISENTELLGGIVSVHSRVRDDIYDALDGFIGGAAIHYTGKMPEGKLFLL